MLTYKSHLNKDEYRKWFLKKFEWSGEIKIAMCHENGKDDPETPYEHTHVVIHWGKSRTIGKRMVQSEFDYEGIHPNWKAGKGRNAWKDMCKYISKEDKDIGVKVEGEFKDVLTEIWSCNSEREVLELCECPGEVIPYLQAFRYKFQAERHVEYAKKIKNIELSDKQLEWWKRLQVQDDRRILWIADYEGNIGKTTFCKWLRVNQSAERMCLSSKSVNFMYKGSEYVYINLTRSSEEYVSYQALEELKDGDMVSDKYEGRSVLFAPPKVIVMANFYPNKSRLTEDRWEIIKYGEDPMDLPEYNK